MAQARKPAQLRSRRDDAFHSVPCPFLCSLFFAGTFPVRQRTADNTCVNRNRGIRACATTSTDDVPHRCADLLEAGVDLAVRIGRLPDSGVAAKRLAPCRMVARASLVSQPLGRPLSADDLAADRFLAARSSHRKSVDRRSLRQRKSCRRDSKRPLRFSSSSSDMMAPVYGTDRDREPAFGACFRIDGQDQT
jgi:LysR substrate binding domain